MPENSERRRQDIKERSVRAAQVSCVGPRVISCLSRNLTAAGCKLRIFPILEWESIRKSMMCIHCTTVLCILLEKLAKTVCRLENAPLL
jgi:hypothetical protein